ncbi:uncharacterized protein SPPG_02490 [Spizellomyces punctatus DAOM BR117]|uniref:Hexosyltransferase n=1 Tax=Spizellomyces punctatus (strain DAOM BR117) TaxID=645134 RepID=A0A0L0HMD2_SPIPD|nr:uncharacterized protein SPPG_02490 [Spizellomyces punctatus DAOM BR117]KND01984.1 hypothetical protein SPPG_02490 [Spizellomyces punctatus DAOM BR117]|eukprot:XP_016610023.1 hypothetical protein SPPG_02490 [Spizellomyces punctatus DAOM BR117]
MRPHVLFTRPYMFFVALLVAVLVILWQTQRGNEETVPGFRNSKSSSNQESISVLRDELRAFRKELQESHKKSLESANKTVLVGLLTVPDKIQRRALIRATYLQLKPPGVDFYFVFGKPKAPEIAHLLAWEKRIYKDIMILDCDENMDNGKTFHFFDFVSHTFPDGRYDFVMKTDDDVFLHLPNLEKRLRGLPKHGTYFGRNPGGTGFMAGLGYVLSWDLVKWVGSDPYPQQNKEGQEDGKVASWLRYGNKITHWVSEDEEIYDDPASGRGWAHPYTPGTILIHRLKEDIPFLTACAHFLDSALADLQIS